MKIARQAQGRLSAWLAQLHGARPSRRHRAQATSTLACNDMRLPPDNAAHPEKGLPTVVLALPDRVVATADRAFDVPRGLPWVVVQQDVDPPCTARFAGGISACGLQHPSLGDFREP